MKYIEILANGIALPKKRVDNNILDKELNLSENWIYDRTGIKQRYYIENETLTSLAIEGVKNTLSKTNIDIQDIGIIIFATTSTKKLMPGISYEIQKELDIKRCMCLDLLCRL